MKIENKAPIAEEIIRNNPTGHGLFAGIGDNFNSVAQVICELMDDAVSNLRANKDDPELSMRVVLSLENLGDAVEITVTDGGTGIADLSSALTIACRDGAQTPLNEHGFGLKHALASCDSSPEQKWSIRTRTKADAAANQYREVKAPYSMGTSELDKPMRVRFYSGTGDLPNPTGTSISVRCPMAKFRTVKPDRINVFNATHVIPDFGMTIDEMLVYIPQLTQRKNKLADMKARLPKQRVEEQYGRQSNIIDYSYANYDLTAVEADYEKVSDELSRAQLALDAVNQRDTFELAE